MAWSVATTRAASALSRRIMRIGSIFSVGGTSRTWTSSMMAWWSSSAAETIRLFVLRSAMMLTGTVRPPAVLGRE